MKRDTDLRLLLQEIDHKGYPAYKQTAGKWAFRGFLLSIDHVQGDPFASPSNVSMIIDGKQAGFPAEYYKEKHRRISLEDGLLRRFSKELSNVQTDRAGSGKSGLLSTSRPGQEILERTALCVDKETGSVTVRFEVGFPAHGRTVFVKPLERIFFSVLPKLAESCFYYQNLDQKKIRSSIELADDVLALRNSLKELGLCAFVANGSILARESGISQKPMKDAVAFVSPESLCVSVDLPHKGTIRGMGVKEGIFLIVGGGYHGKSTLLLALERGVYDHIAGDGREFVVTRNDAMKIRAEDGRSVRSVDVSLFINDLPNKTDTGHFSTEDASGSTSQAAAVVEAVEAGTSLFLVDEDTCATNFMVRDDLMRQVVAKDKEPITPFLSRMRQLYAKAGISTVLVAGSSGSFFGVADTVIQMDEYVPKDVTELAKEVYLTDRAQRGNDAADDAKSMKPYEKPTDNRIVKSMPQWRKPTARIKTKVMSTDTFSIDKETVDLRGLGQIVDREQTQALAAAFKYLACHVFNDRNTLCGSVDQLYEKLLEKGPAVLYEKGTIRCGLAMPRREELIGALNRWRRLTILLHDS